MIHTDLKSVQNQNSIAWEVLRVQKLIYILFTFIDCNLMSAWDSIGKSKMNGFDGY